MSLPCVSYYVDRYGNFGVVGVVLLVNAYSMQYFPSTVVVSYLTSCACIAAAISKGLKRAIKLPRPSGALKASPGMPSNHATSLSFLFLTTTYALQRYTDSAVTVRGVNQTLLRTPSLLPLSVSLVWPLQVLVAVYSLYATGLRVTWGHHTVAQVCAGYVLGLLFAILSLAANYSGYKGSRPGGRVDDLPLPMKVAILLTGISISAMATHSIARGVRAACFTPTGPLLS
ncbi:hypothetical protein LSCM1_06065 [Leishmania martiniquensis]|uniref:Phosphatidic acid phosphatase type 2/haloperoxidase domain-containing protein n=1 Tax=Leishmania martiniquensis TaxID=1580590 RepID=A0A836HIR1_9TRYP|nr:hypothetical protein LSCM1_06065 [Leishmania martiniquensis]